MVCFSMHLKCFMAKNRIGIVRGGGISPLGNSFVSQISQAYFNSSHFLRKEHDWVSTLPSFLNEEIQEYILENGFDPHKYSKEAKMIAFVINQLSSGGYNSPGTMLNVATSRGSIDFLAGILSKYEGIPVYSSPHTTHGLLSSWPGHLISTERPVFFNSSTCSSFGITLMNGMAWLRSGMAEEFIAASVEAPANSLTIHQLKALRIYSNQPETVQYPCRAMDFKKRENTLVLGESSFAYLLKNNILGCKMSIDGLGVGVEKIKTATSLTDEGSSLIIAVNNALLDADYPTVDVIVGHFPGTVKGDLSELSAYNKVFRDKMPVILGNKWKIGHSLGSSLAANLELAILMLETQKLPEMPEYLSEENRKIDRINTILISSLGFGGQAVSAIISLAESPD